MACNITLSYFGPPEQKHIVKVPPMQTLAQALAAAAGKFKPALVPEHCALHINNKPVDLHTPFRLLNVPAGSKLEVLIHRPKQEAGSSAAAAANAAAAAAVPNESQPQAAAAPAASVPRQQAPAAPPPAAPSSSTPAPTAQAPAVVQAPAQVPQQQQQQQSAPAPVAQAQASAAPVAEAGPSSSAAAAAADAPGPLSALGVQGQVYVFNQRALEAAAQGPKPMELDPPDDFFELTTEDLVRLQQDANRRKQADTLFKPRAMREAEKAAVASSLGPIRVRLHFPDATIVQASFTACQPLSAVQQLVLQLALDAVAPALYLYTTPPKTVLKDPTATLYQLKLVPAAHLYVGCEHKRLKAPAAAAVAGDSYPGPFLKPEVLALMQDSAPDQHDPEGGQQQEEPGEQSGSAAVTAADVQRAMAAAAAASRAEAGSSSRAAAAGGGAKVPKWLKMGK